MKILISAFACDSKTGSEPGLGWDWVNFVSQYFKVHLITADRGRNEVLIDAIQADEVLSRNVTVEFIPFTLPQGSAHGLALRYFQPYYYHFYQNWLKRSFSLARQLVKEKSVGLVHQCTYHTFREPGDFWKLPVPSVWAPVAGTTDVPFSMLSALGPLEGMKQGSRSIINTGHKYFNQRFRRAVRGYSKVIAGSDHAAALLGKFRDDVEVIPGQLIKQKLEVDLAPVDSSGLQLVFCGQHFSRKGGAFAIEALARVPPHLKVHLHMIGEGQMTGRWKELARKHGVDGSITWYGRVERQKVYGLLSKCDVFVFPSLQDCYPAVISEAFSVGLPVITTDLPGVGDMVDEKSGIKIQARSPRYLVNGLANAIVDLAQNRAKLERLREGVKVRREAFLFENRMKRMLEIYEELLR